MTTIKKGKRRPAFWWLRWPLWLEKRTISRQVTFFAESKYNLNGPDQEDHNKLFGIGYFPNQHKDSARFGWRYDTKTDKFIISAYCYVDGQRIMTGLCEVMVNTKYVLTLSVRAGHYGFVVQDAEINYPVTEYAIPFWHKKKWSYPLGPYFGGNRKAPNDITLEIKKV